MTIEQLAKLLTDTYGQGLLGTVVVLLLGRFLFLPLLKLVIDAFTAGIALAESLRTSLATAKELVDDLRAYSTPRLRIADAPSEKQR